MEEVIQGQSCTGFQVSQDGARFRLRLTDSEGQTVTLEFPTASLESLMKTLPEIQQVALPRGRGNGALRVIRHPEAWSCFHLDDTELFKMARSLRDERAVTLPAPDWQQ